MFYNRKDAGQKLARALEKYKDKDVLVLAIPKGGMEVAYERIEVVDGMERLVMLSTGIDPYDPALPEPRRSFLRHDLDDHLLEIYF